MCKDPFKEPGCHGFEGKLISFDIQVIPENCFTVWQYYLYRYIYILLISNVFTGLNSQGLFFSCSSRPLKCLPLFQGPEGMSKHKNGFI